MLQKALSSLGNVGTIEVNILSNIFIMSMIIFMMPFYGSVIKVKLGDLKSVR